MLLLHLMQLRVVTRSFISPHIDTRFPVVTVLRAGVLVKNSRLHPRAPTPKPPTLTITANRAEESSVLKQDSEAKPLNHGCGFACDYSIEGRTMFPFPFCHWCLNMGSRFPRVLTTWDHAHVHLFMCPLRPYIYISFVPGVIFFQ